MVADLPIDYVQVSDLNDLIQTYLDEISAGSAMKNRMVPYSVVPYFGPLTYFDMTGAGTGDWDRIFLCNGKNSTPDLRGRVIVGTTNGMGGDAFAPAVDPGIAGNPNYSLNDTFGENNVILSEAELASHSHNTSLNITDPEHYHYEFSTDLSTGSSILSTTYPIQGNNSGATYQIWGNTTEPTLGKSSSSPTGISIAVTNPTTGSSEAHNNIQPVMASHYIIYLP